MRQTGKDKCLINLHGIEIDQTAFINFSETKASVGFSFIYINTFQFGKGRNVLGDGVGMHIGKQGIIFKDFVHDSVDVFSLMEFFNP